MRRELKWLGTYRYAVVNLGAVLGMLPITGVPLPFVSFGGSSMLVTMVSAGILVNIGSTRERVYSDAMPDPILGLGVR